MPREVALDVTRRRWYERMTETISGAGAGSFVAVVSNPLDVIRTRVQVDGIGVRETVRTLMREEGWRGFMKGASARLLMLAPNGAIIMSAYELVKRLSLKAEVAEEWGEETSFGSALDGTVAGAGYEAAVDRSGVDCAVEDGWR
jgi:hypothetical protein